MGKVLKADASSADAYVYKSLSVAANWKIQFDLYIPSSTFTALAADQFTPDLVEMSGSGGGVDSTFITAHDTSGGSHTFSSGNMNWWTGWASAHPAASFTADTWLRSVVITYDGSDNISFSYGGVTLFTYNEPGANGGHSFNPLENLWLGSRGAIHASGEIFYFANVKVYDASNAIVFSDDFSSGGLGAWDSTSGSVSVVSDPSPPPPVFAGIMLAPTNGPLDDPVDWTRIDNLDGLEIEGVSIKRGRPTERDKTTPGTVTITGYDTQGILDPTNSGSPLAPHLVPTKQAAVTLYNPDTGIWNYLFRGHISNIQHELDPSKRWSKFTLELVDMLDILNDAEIIPDQAGNTVPQESVGDVFYTGQHIDDRLLAVLADSGTAFMGQIWPVSLLQIASGNVNVQGCVYSRGTSLLQVIDEACDAEFPGATNRFITVDGSFAFRGRYYRFVPSAYIPSDNTHRTAGTRMLHWNVGDLQAYDSDNTLTVPQNVKFKIDKTDLINTAFVTPYGISDAQLASGSQLDSDSTSIGDYGPRTSGMSLENLKTGDADDGNTPLQETASFSTATVHNYKDPVTFVNEVVFRNPVQGDGDYAARWKLLSGIELSDLFTYTGTNPGGGGFSAVDHYVEELGYELKPLRGDTWDVTLTVGLSAKKHFSYMPGSWNPPSGGGGSTLAAHFSFITSGLSVQFYDESTPGPSGPITAWDWDFGDSSPHGTTPNPTHTYASSGTYTVVLTVTGTSPDGTANKSKSVTVA